VQDIMQVVQFQKKGIHLNTIERFHIHKEAAANNHLNDDHTLSPNKILETILKDFQTES
jgi:Fe-S-cluster formation regulator IscX/YfhJ